MTLPESAHRLFEGDRHATIVTINPDGTPQTSLVWASRDSDDILIGMEGRRPKARNLLRDPRVTLLVEDDRKDERGLVQYLLVHGKASITGPGIPAEWTAFMDRQAARYLGPGQRYDLGNRDSPTAVIARITPDRIGGIGPWA